RWEDGDDTLNRLGGVEGVQSRENQVASFRGKQCRGNGFEVAHFPDQNDVGILTEGGAQCGGEIGSVDFDFALIDEALFVAMQELDGVFNGDEMVGTVGVDAVDHGGQRGGFAGSGGAGDQDEPTLLFANAID